MRRTDLTVSLNADCKTTMIWRKFQTSLSSEQRRLFSLNQNSAKTFLKHALRYLIIQNTEYFINTKITIYKNK
jgi:hypothetical protein